MPSPGPASRWGRVSRGWSTAAATTTLAAVAHGLAGGGFPHPLALAFAVVFAGLLCMILAGRRLSRSRLGLMVLASQGIFHGLFTLFGTGSGAASLVETAGGHHPGYVVTVTDAAATVRHDDMWMLHACAAFGTYLLICHGMAVVAGLRATAAMLLAPLLGAGTLAPPLIEQRAGRPAIDADPPRPVSRPFVLSSRRRGPPLIAIA